MTRNGGIGRLREVIEDHVAEHGLKLPPDDARAEAKKLRAQTMLMAPGASVEAKNTASASALGSCIIDLGEEYRKIRELYRGKQVPELTVDDNGDSSTVSDMVLDRLTEEVLDWPIWHKLFSSVNEGRVEVDDDIRDEYETRSRSRTCSSPTSSRPSTTWRNTRSRRSSTRCRT